MKISSGNPLKTGSSGRHGTILKKTVLFLTIALCFAGCKQNDSEQLNGPDIIASDKSGTAGTSSVADFTIAVIPDTQYYVSSQFGGTPAMFTQQIDWIKANQATENIQYVVSLGDITDHGNDVASEWTNGSTNGYYKLESQAGFTNGIPYGTCVGNHDQTPNTGHPLTCSTSSYNGKFGANRFRPRAYYGENYAGTGSNSNDCHYDLFTAGGIDFIVIYTEYDSHGDDGANMNTWAYNLLGTFSSRKAIIVSHMMTNSSGAWGTTGSTYEQGHVLYDRIKSRPNVFMMLGGHFTGESSRSDVYNGNTIRTFLTDYQGWANGGDGYMRLMKFSVNNNTVSMKTYSPHLNVYQIDSNSQFTVPFFELGVRYCDFNGNGKSEQTFFNNGVWKVYGSADVTNGIAGDIAVPGDYNGDGTTDKVVYRPATGYWYNVPGTSGGISWGLANTDIPVPGDYDGNGSTEVVLFRPSTGQWFSYTGGYNLTWGQAGDIPVPGDYNGDGKTDMCVYRPSNFTWYVRTNYPETNGSLIPAVTWGQAGDIPVPGDYNGDNQMDMTVYRPSTGQWFPSNNVSSGGSLPGFPIVFGGAAGDIPCPGDYIGDRATELSYYRAGTWYVNGGTNVVFGNVPGGDKLVNLPWSIRKFYFP